jgi:prepilin-type N-terminal cleavage/methylation domain-containing protein
MNPFAVHTEKGFTLIEMMIVIAVIMIVLALPVFSMMQLRQDAVLKEGVVVVQQALSLARARALSGTEGSAHGVYVDANALTIFVGDTYTGVGEVYQLPNGLTLTATANPVVFERLSGITSANVLTLTNAHSNTKSVQIDTHGFFQ